MGDNSERIDHFNLTNLLEWIKKARNPVEVLCVLTIFGIATYIKIIPLNIIPILLCLFAICCIVYRSTIKKCFNEWIKMKKYQEKQKTKRYLAKQKRKQVEKEYEYLMKQSENAIKNANNGSSQSTEDTACKIYEIKRKRS